MKDNNLYEAFKVSLFGQIVLAISLAVSLSFLFCWNLIEAPCSDKFDFKNIIAALIAFASLSNLIPRHWYESIGNLFKVIVALITNEDGNGAFDRILDSKPTIVAITATLITVIISISIIFILRMNEIMDLLNSKS